jgi:UDP-3-O-[3-hydroxymyristoyl] glucosamine N-acyltransferase
MKLSEIIHQFGDTTIDHSLKTNGNDPDIVGVAAIDEATDGNISYVESGKFVSSIATTKASALILPDDQTIQAKAEEHGIPWLATKQPRLLFAQAIAIFYQPYHPAPAIHPTAVIHPTAKVGEGVYIGPHVVIQERAEIGNGVIIHPNVVIYPDVKIGDRTILHANCTIEERSQIGADCIIHSGAVIGGEGFGFVPTRNGWYKMQQSGYVVLEDRVDIGCNSTIDRPSVGETRIGSDTKIDNLVQIAHGCQIGKGCAIAAQTGMAGGVTLGNRVILAGQVGIANQAKLGDGATVSAQSGILHDVEPGDIVSGTPSVPHKLYLKVAAIYKHFPEMYQLFRQLQRQNK